MELEMLDTPQFEAGETCEFAHPSINGQHHSAGTEHHSGFTLCDSCGAFMDQLERLTSSHTNIIQQGIVR